MPFRRRRFNYRRRRPAYRRRKLQTGLAVVPRLMSRSYRFKRMNQVDTRTAWFKYNGTIDLNDQPFQYYEFRTASLYASNPNGWQEFLRLYDQFKILGFTYKLFPANVGTEPFSNQGSAVPGAPFYLNRGNHCIWSDQRLDGTVQSPTTIAEVINTASARLINARRPYTRSIWRPKGKPLWGSTRNLIQQPDTWTGVINHLIEGGTQQAQGVLKPIYYYTVTFKVCFRGRQDD